MLCEVPAVTAATAPAFTVTTTSTVSAILSLPTASARV